MLSIGALLILVIVLALAFDLINGFHDTANAIATSVSTKVLSPAQAIFMAAGLNFVGALSGTKVAQTIGKGIVNPEAVTMHVLVGALLGAIAWNLLTWYYGLPSSSSHALIGGLCGSAIAARGISVLDFKGLTEKILIPLVTSPVLGFVFAFLVMILLIWLVKNMAPKMVNKYFSKFQIVSAAFMAFSHGSNDAQKAMGIITLALFSAGKITTFEVPVWVILACATAMGIGTAFGGWKIIKTMGSKIIKLEPIHGFAAETSAALVILGASKIGVPVSTTHVISSSIMGVGATKRLSAVRWGVAKTIVYAWIFTIPASAAIAALSYYIINGLF